MERPAGAVTDDFSKQHRGLGGSLGRQVIAGDLGATVRVEDADVGVADIAEVLLPVFGVVDAHWEDDPGDTAGQPVETDVDLLVVGAFAGSFAVSLAGQVVAPVDDLTQWA